LRELCGSGMGAARFLGRAGVFGIVVRRF
jgi:hypothetical protein